MSGGQRHQSPLPMATTSSIPPLAGPIREASGSASPIRNASPAMAGSPPGGSSGGVPAHRRYNLTPAEQQAYKLEKLLANADRPVTLPQAPREKTIRAPHEMMKNVSGSSAGAGSGEFHVYKHSRRREFERVKLMEEAAEKERQAREFEQRQTEVQAELSAKTSKNRAKRDKKKAARAKAKGSTNADRGHPTQDQDQRSTADPLTDGKRFAEDGSGVNGEGKRKRINAEGAAQIVFKRRGEGEASEEEASEDDDGDAR